MLDILSRSKCQASSVVVPRRLTRPVVGREFSCLQDFIPLFKSNQRFHQSVPAFSIGAGHQGRSKLLGPLAPIQQVGSLRHCFPKAALYAQRMNEKDLVVNVMSDRVARITIGIFALSGCSRFEGEDRIVPTSDLDVNMA